MKAKRITALLLTAAMLLTACGSGNTSENENASAEVSKKMAADPFGKYDEPVTFTVAMAVDPNEVFPEGDSYTNNQYIRYIEEELNVKIEFLWTASASDFDTKVNLAITSNQIPDAMVVNATQFNQMYKANQLADLTDVYESYASDVMKEMIGSSNGLAIDNVSYGDRMYGLTSTSDGDYELTWIRKDWMDKLGLEEPESIEDLKNIAQAFVDNDMGGKGRTIGISGPQNGGNLYASFLNNGTNNYGFDNVFNGFGAYPGWWTVDAEGNPNYGSTSAETRAALQELATWYKEGLIDPEMGIRQDAAEPIIAGQSGIFSGGWWMGYAALPDVIANNPEANYQAYAIPVHNSEGIYTPHATSASYAYLAVSKDCKNPEIAIKLNNLLIRDESKFDTSKAIIGDYPCRIPFGMLDESEYTVQAMRAILSGEKKIEDYTEADFAHYKMLKNDLEKVKSVKLDPIDKMDIQYWDIKADPSAWARSYSLLVGWAPLVDTEFKPVYSAIYQQTPMMEQRWANLEKMEKEVFTKIIMNQEPIESFDQFVTDWKAQGGDTITEEVKEYYKSKQS